MSKSPYMIRSSAWVLPEKAGVWDGYDANESGFDDLNALFNETVRNRIAVDNSGRFPAGTRAAFVASVMALEAGGRLPDESRDSTTGVVAAGFDHTLEQNKDYFQDYVDNGRVMGRGNLFIYTLPTSAIAEVAIGLGMEGPLFYEEVNEAPFAGLLRAGTDCMGSGHTEQMMAIWQDVSATVVSLLVTGPAHGRPADDVAVEATEWTAPSSVIEYFRRIHVNQ